jgi:uncharacterized protein DUF4129
MRQVPADSLGTVLDSVFAAPKYAWVPRAHPGLWILEQFRSLLEWFARLETGQPLVYWGIVTTAVVVLVAILVHAGWLMSRTIGRSTAPDPHEATTHAERRDGPWYRARAARLAAAGRYPEAMRLHFEGIVLDLAQAGLVKWHPSKTPREYTREAKLSAEDRARFTSLVDGVYAASFAGAAWSAAEWESWRAAAGRSRGA